MSFVLFLYYRWANARKDRKASLSQATGSEMGQWDNLTDKENPTFRYVY